MHASRTTQVYRYGSSVLLHQSEHVVQLVAPCAEGLQLSLRPC